MRKSIPNSGAHSAIIFDLDGTLLNTLEDIAFAMNSVLRKHGYPEHSTSAYRYFVGGGLYNLVFHTIPENARIPKLLNTYLDELLDEYSKCIDTQTKPYSGICDMLEQLTQKNIPMAILSNKAHEFMDEVVQQHFSKWNFKVVFGARPTVATKPDPYSALEIASIMQIEPCKIAYLGDTDVDMQTAVNAGMYGIGAAWGFRTQTELIDNGAQLIIHHPMELLNIF
ncbi:MAG: phosphoglycolate phosphatase [Pseudomonadota bacterium]|nr:phosphoglycolate phosphatase [Pseudomonadota bacterium]